MTRRIGEVVCIGPDIFVKILSVNRNQVRIGLTAPKDVEIYREEILQRMRAGAQESSIVPLEDLLSI